MNTAFSEYTLPVSADPSYYGPACTQTDADRIARQIGGMAKTEFPGLQIRTHELMGGSGKITGPDESVCEEIRAWVENNWTAAL